MGNKTSYLIDLHSLKFDELQGGNASSWIQAMPLGKYNHPVYGEIDITPERVQQFAANVASNVRGQELDIDYDHKEYGGDAAGWVKSAEARLNESDPRHNGLWVLVEWVHDAYEKIKKGAYKYFSPEFEDEWKHPVTGTAYKDVLNGGGITNRPFLKGILPLNLNEKFTEGTHMFTEEEKIALRKKFNLSDTATDAEISAAVMAAELKSEDTEQLNEDTAVVEPEAANAANAASLSELTTTDLKLLSENPATVKLLNMVQVQNKQLKEMSDAAAVTKLSETFAAKGMAISPTALSAIEKAIQLSDGSVRDAIMIAFNSFADKGIIQLGESKVTTPDTNGGATVDSMTKLNERVTAIMASEKITYGEAMLKASKELPDVYESYRKGE